MPDLDKFLPITVIAAVFLFLVKETIEAFKKKAERNRKLSAYKILIAEEMSKNGWSIFGVRRIIERLSDHDWIVEVIKNADGACHLKTTRGEDVVNGIVLQFHSSVFDKHIIDLAVLDRKFFLQVRDTYQALADAKVSRATMLEMCVDPNMRPFLDHYLRGVVAVVNAAEAKINKTYTACTGEQLDTHKHTSYV